MKSKKLLNVNFKFCISDINSFVVLGWLVWLRGGDITT